MSSVIGPVVRALKVLHALNHQPHSTLLSLHEATGLPKSTLHRLLATLKSEGYVRADVVKGAYSLTAKVRELSEGFTEHDLVVELGAPILLKTTRNTGLPLAIGVLEQGRIAVRYSSMPYSPVGSEHTTVGHVHDLIHSGMGQAFMAWCGDTERTRLMQLLESATPDVTQWPRIQADLEQSIVTTRARGYGLRKAEGPGASATLAVPMLHEARIVGVLSLTTFGALLTPATTQECLTLLKQTCADVSNAMAAFRVTE